MFVQRSIDSALINKRHRARDSRDLLRLTNGDAALWRGQTVSSTSARGEKRRERGDRILQYVIFKYDLCFSENEEEI